jgi:Pentapeptide repeats (8 copies)
LRSSNLISADLSYADFTDADLRNANLTEANLTNTSFIGANIKKARFGYNLGISQNMKLDLIERGAIFEDLPEEPSEYFPEEALEDFSEEDLEDFPEESSNVELTYLDKWDLERRRRAFETRLTISLEN